MPSVNLNPEAYGTSTDDIMQLIASGEKPPKYSSTELDKLDYHNTGIAAVREALKEKPVPHMAYRELSRYASHVACTRMASLPILNDLKLAFEAYNIAKKPHNQKVRTEFIDRLDGESRGYAPYVAGVHIHVWFWSMEDKNAVLAMAGDAGVVSAVFFGFVADALSELPGLGAITQDLVYEYQRVLRHLDWVLNSVEYTTKALNETSFT